MSDAAPPPWVRRLRKRENGVDAGLKILLITCWGYGPYNRKGPEESRDGAHPLGAAPERQPAKPVTLWACVETLAEESGQPEGTVKDQLRRAIAKGWIRRDKGSRMTLAWRAPGVFEYGTRTADRPNRTVDQPDGGPTCPDDGPTAADGGPAAARTVGRPQTFHDLPIELPTNVVEARTPHGLDAMTADEKLVVYGTPVDPSALPPPPKPRPAQTSLVTGKPSAAQRSAQPQLERERAEVRARFSGPPSDVLTAVMLEAVNPEHRDAWVQEAAGGEYGSWSTAMGERARKLGLTREALGVAVLASWERECAEHPPGVKPGQPDRGELWYGKHSAWLRKAAGLGGSTSKPKRGRSRLSCVEPSNTDLKLITTLPGLDTEKWERIAAAERAEGAS